MPDTKSAPTPHQGKAEKAMKMEGLHEKEIFSEKQPFRLIVNSAVDFFYPAHWHNAIELIYVTQGTFAVTVGSECYPLQEGDIFYIPSGELHECKGVSATGTRIFINFDLSTLSFYDNWGELLRTLRDTMLITQKEGGLYQQIAAQFISIVQDNAADNQLFYLARMIDILLPLCKCNDKAIHPGYTAKNKTVGLEKINKSFEYIENNYARDISLKEIARAVGFSEYYFSRLFKQITEKNFHQYLNEFRIQKARILLMSSVSISQAAHASGFSSLTTFDRLFRKMNGCSAQEFRKRKASL